MARSSIPDDKPEKPVFMRVCELFGMENQETKSQNTSFQKIFHRRYDPRWSGAEVPSSRLAPLDFQNIINVFISFRKSSFEIVSGGAAGVSTRFSSSCRLCRSSASLFLLAPYSSSVSIPFHKPSSRGLRGQPDGPGHAAAAGWSHRLPVPASGRGQ